MEATIALEAALALGAALGRHRKTPKLPKHPVETCQLIPREPGDVSTVSTAHPPDRRTDRQTVRQKASGTDISSWLALSLYIYIYVLVYIGFSDGNPQKGGERRKFQKHMIDILKQRFRCMLEDRRMTFSE